MCRRLATTSSTATHPTPVGMSITTTAGRRPTKRGFVNCLRRLRRVLFSLRGITTDYRENEMLARHWNQFNVVTRDHFYHSGGKIENRRSIVEALVFNFSAHIEQHNHGVVPKPEQLMLLEERAEYVAQQLGRECE